MHPERVTQGPAVTVVESDASEDRDWDSFLEGTALGQFQQSSMWGRSKVIEGWAPHRVALVVEGKIVGGFQLLWRRTRLGRVGYVSKGPVLEAEDPGLAASLAQLLRKAVTRLRCLAVIIQPPDFSKVFEQCLVGTDYDRNRLIGVIDATLLVDLRTGLVEATKRLHKSTRRNVRLGAQRGLSLVDGDESHLPEFFRLMCITCERQKTKPNPRSLEHLQAIWAAFAPSQRIRLSFARWQQELVAGQVSLLFGSRWTLWKRGWSGSHPYAYPNDYLTWELIKLAGASGSAEVDHASMVRKSAESILRGDAESTIAFSSRDRFHLGFGGHPVLLPKSCVWIPHPVLRTLYRVWVRLRSRS